MTAAAHAHTPETLEDIAARIAERERSQDKTVLEHALEQGADLIAARAQVNHGGFGKWIAENTAISWNLANKYMRIAEGRKLCPRAQSVREALKLISAAQREPKPKLSAEDIEQAKKFMAVSPSQGSRPSEVEKARQMLRAVAARFGISVSQLKAKAIKATPPNERYSDPADDLARWPKEKLVDFVCTLIKDMPDVKKRYGEQRK